MPLSVPEPPAPALRSVHAALKSATAVRETRTPALTSTTGPVSCTSPLPLYELDGFGAGAQEGQPRARLNGWRFQLRDGGRVVAAAEAMLTPDGWAFSHFCEGPYIASTERALRQAESLTTSAQPRLLSVPGLYMLTLWLHRDAAADPGAGELAPDDLLVPLAPAPPGIPSHRARRADALLPVFRKRLAPVRLLGTTI